MVGVMNYSIALRGPYRTNRDHLDDEWARLELLIRAEVIRWRQSATGAAPENTWGMVVVSHEEVEAYLNSPIEPPGMRRESVSEEVTGCWEEAARLREAIDRLCRDSASSPDLRLPALVRLFRLSPEESDVLLLCLLAEIDDRHRRLFAYLQNDASRQVLNVEVVSQILSVPQVTVGVMRDLFSPSGALLANHLVVVGSPDQGLSLRSVRIDDRIASYLLDSDDSDARLVGIVSDSQALIDQPVAVRPDLTPLVQHLSEVAFSGLQQHHPVRLALFGADHRLAGKVAQAIGSAVTCSQVVFDVKAALRSSVPWEQAVDLAYREARLRRAMLYFSGCETLFSSDAERSRWEYVERAAAGFKGLSVIGVDSTQCPLGAINDAQFCCIELPMPDYETRKQLWTANLPSADTLAVSSQERETVASDLANTFRVTESQIEDAVAGAANLARRDARENELIRVTHLFESCRSQAGRRLVAFAQRIVPRPSLSLDHVVLTAPNKGQLLDLQNRIRHHRELMHLTGLERSMRLGKGLLALFAGSSGTGKTMAAEALASGQGVDLYKVDLSAVVSKWIGETEKNLSRIFAEAEHSNGWLFFDEGESLFGSRGDIRQAQDRFLNLEVNFLLQRIEEFSGVVILATNLRQHIDDAFLRRIHAVVEFPSPNAALRAEIWRGMIPARVRRGFDEQQLARFAARFELSGGNIRNAFLDGMFRAYATEDRILTLRHLAAGVAREYQKLGRPIAAAEFGDTFYAGVVEDILDPLLETTATKDT